MTAIDQIEFRGLIGNRLLASITTNEFMNALAAFGWGEAHNGHILQKLRERGSRWGIRTPNEFARALRNGRTQWADDGAKARICCNGQCWVIYREETQRFITLRDPRE
jgi:hypothetical protein